MGLPVFDCLQRGLMNLRANWELIPLQFLQMTIATLFVLGGLLPSVAAVGGGDLVALGSWDNPRQILGLWQRLTASGWHGLSLIATALAVGMAIWGVGLLVYCYFHGGIMGVLRASDRQAPRSEGISWHWFRTFSWEDFRGWSRLYMWRYFALFNLFLLFSSLWVVVLAAWAGVTGWGTVRWGVSAGVGIGCGGAMLVLFIMIVLGGWFGLAQAALASESASVSSATRDALSVLGRRFTALIFLLVFGVICAILATSLSSIASVSVKMIFGEWAAVRLALQVAISLMEWVFSGVVSVVLSAALVSLVRSESPSGIAG